MKRLMLCLVSVSFLAPSLAFCQEQQELEGDPEYEMHLREMDMELQAREAKMEYERKLAELELEARRADLERAEQEPDDGLAAVLLIICAVVHVLVGVWIYQDIRQRNAGSGLWIVLGLLAGLIAALVYAVVRLGDDDTGKKRANSR